MKLSLKKVLTVALVVPTMALTVVGMALPASAADDCDPKGGFQQGLNCVNNEAFADDLWGKGGVIQTIINVIFFLIAALCVIFIVWGGFTYMTSRGDSKKVESAKNTILYAIIGLVIAILAYAIVFWVLDIFGKAPAAEEGFLPVLYLG